MKLASWLILAATSAALVVGGYAYHHHHTAQQRAERELQPAESIRITIDHNAPAAEPDAPDAQGAAMVENAEKIRRLSDAQRRINAKNRDLDAGIAENAAGVERNRRDIERATKRGIENAKGIAKMPAD